jgi:anti-sigma-K factor RskA/putative zinc finger protein
MTRTTHVIDDLELYALDALPAADRDRVSAHLAGCAACREQSRLLEEVAIALPNTLPLSDLPARLRARILMTARTDRAPAPHHENAWTSWLRPSRAAVAALATLVLILGTAEAYTLGELRTAQAERDEYADGLLRVSHGGPSWYMAGRDQWTGSGGTLISPSKPDSAAFVVFHDLRPVTQGAIYALWLVDVDGHWVRAANFTPNGEAAQTVVLDAPVTGFTQCALTVELQREGKRAGPLVMQSRIGPTN